MTVLYAALLAAGACGGGEPAEPAADYVTMVQAERLRKAEAFRRQVDERIPLAKQQLYLPLKYFPIDPAYSADTGSVHHSNITARTFDISRRATEVGVDAAAVARQVFDSHSVGKLRLMGALLADMRLEAGGRLAVLHLDEALLQETGGSRDDTEGLINLPLAAREIQAVVMFKSERHGETRVSLRSKGSVDVRSVASRHGGGGHTNAAGFTAQGSYADVHARVVREAAEAIALAGAGSAGSA